MSVEGVWLRIEESVALNVRSEKDVKCVKTPEVSFDMFRDRRMELVVYNRLNGLGLTRENGSQSLPAMRNGDLRGLLGQRHGIGRRLFFYMVLFSFMLTLIRTAAQLYYEYQRELAALEQRFAEIEKSRVPSIESCLWTLDLDMLRVQLSGILQLPAIAHVEVRNNGAVLESLGAVHSHQGIKREYPLSFEHRDRRQSLGTLIVQACPEGLMDRLSDKAGLILASEAVQTFLVAAFLFVLFYLMVGRPLHALAQYALSLNLSQLETPLRIDRRRGHEDDEIGLVSLAINEMRENLIRDIEARKSAERSLVLSEDKFRRITENLQADYFFYSHDAAGVVQFVSPSITHILGYTPEEFLNYFEMFLADDPVNEAAREHTMLSMEGVKQPSFLMALRHRNGQTVWVEASDTPVFDERGAVIAVEGIAHDVTERRRAAEERARLEEQLLQAQKMEAVGTLAGGIAHDFNNILAAVLGYTELALDDLDSDSPAVPHLAQVMKAGNRAKDLVKQILAFSRQSEMDRKPVRIQVVVQEALQLLRATLPSTIEIREELDPLTGTVLADPTRIHQVLLNLCTNAKQAMGRGGGILRVSLKSERIMPGMEQHDLPVGSYACLEVSDSGAGMGEETIAKIFDPFFTTKQQGEGTGLGLSVVHGIVKSHRGRITVDSRPGKGARFQIHLPLVTMAGEGEESAFGSPLPTGSERVLLVDDEQMLCEMGKAFLTRLGYTVTAFTDSTLALEQFKAAPEAFDVVITDMTMPRITGLDIAREVLSARPDMPVVLCTGFSELVTEQTAEQCGIRELLNKPLVMKDLAIAVRRALSPEERSPSAD